jgi:hypothetical protein
MSSKWDHKDKNIGDIWKSALSASDVSKNFEANRGIYIKIKVNLEIKILRFIL